MNVKSNLQVLFLTASLCAISFFARGQSLLGNSPTDGAAFNFVGNGAIAGGGAIAFSPLYNCTFSSITLWLSGYTGLDNQGRTNQSFYATINQDTVYQTGPNTYLHQPGATVLTLDVPPPNNGSPAGFSFVNPDPAIVLSANITYWLFIYESTSGSYNYNDYPVWSLGSTPAGDAIYGGSETFYDFQFSPSSVVPAFDIISVPEPTMLELMVVGGLALAGRGRRMFRSGSLKGQDKPRRTGLAPGHCKWAAKRLFSGRLPY